MKPVPDVPLLIVNSCSLFLGLTCLVLAFLPGRRSVGADSDTVADMILLAVAMLLVRPLACTPRERSL